MIQSRLILLRDKNFTHGALLDLKRCRIFSFTYSFVTYYMKGHFQKSILGTLNKKTITSLPFQKDWSYPMFKTRLRLCFSLLPN